MAFSGICFCLWTLGRATWTVKQIIWLMLQIWVSPTIRASDSELTCIVRLLVPWLFGQRVFPSNIWTDHPHLLRVSCLLLRQGGQS
jgi:hypothetical protein